MPVIHLLAKKRDRGGRTDDSLRPFLPTYSNLFVLFRLVTSKIIINPGNYYVK